MYKILINFVKKHTPLKGFTMAEIVFSLGLVGIIFVCLIQVFIMGHIAIRQSNELITASNIAHEVLERTRMLKFNDISTPSSSSTTKIFDGEAGDSAIVGFPPSPYPSTKIKGVTYYIKTTVSFPESSNNDLIQICVEVTWLSKQAFDYKKGGGSKKFRRKVEFSTMIIDS